MDGRVRKELVWARDPSDVDGPSMPVGADDEISIRISWTNRYRVPAEPAIVFCSTSGMRSMMTALKASLVGGTAERSPTSSHPTRIARSATGSIVG
jgi:hypothetical protein